MARWSNLKPFYALKLSLKSYIPRVQGIKEKKKLRNDCNEKRKQWKKKEDRRWGENDDQEKEEKGEEVKKKKEEEERNSKHDR